MLPIGLHAEALTVLVVGGGATGTRKALAFLEAGARVRVVDPRVGSDLRARSEESLEIVEREFAAADLEDADVAIAATSDPVVNERVVSAARARRCLVNRADAPEESTFQTLAVHRAGGLAIGVSAGGVPGAAARIRDAIAQRFNGRYAEALDRLTRLRSVLLPAGRWPRAAAALLGADLCERIERGDLEQEVRAWD